MNMKNSPLWFSTCLLLCGAIAFPTEGLAQEASDTTYKIDEVVVTGSRMQTDVRHLSQTVTVVDRSKIAGSLQPNVMPVLSEQVPGLFVTSRGIMGYGVSGGAAGNISLRGLSGSSSRFLVLIDGHPQYAGIFGHPITDSYQSFMTERVEVLRGPASMLYGSNAMGGVVNIVTRKMQDDGVKTNMHVGYGSYNTLESELTNRVRYGRFSSVASGSYNRTEGHRDNMGFEQYGGYGKLGYELTDNWSLRADLDLIHFNATYPGPVSAPLLDGDQKITRGVTTFAVDNNYEKTSGGVSFFYNWGHHWINDGYTPSAGQDPKAYRFISNDDMMGVSVYQSVQAFEGNRISAGFDWFRYGGKAWNKYVSGENAGTETQLVDKHEDEVAGYVDVRQNLWTWLTLNAGVRVDHHSRVGTEWVPQFGMSFHLPNAIEIKASASKGFRYPNLREMYMFPPQNPDLEPESLWNYELAWSQRLLENRLTYGINLFYLKAKNIIQTLPNPNGSGMLNQNTGALENSGIETQAAFRINRFWSVDANYSFLHMATPVIAAPEHKLYGGVTFSKGRLMAATGMQYIHGLYTAVGSNETQESFLLWNARAAFRLTDWISLWARGENLLAQKYEINAGYPMPRATIIAGIDINF
jgi:iron complex outermembrane receptor protein